MTRPLQTFVYLFSILSRGINFFIFRGSWYQTLSARAYVESVIDEKQNHWDTYRRLINRLFPWQDNHCEKAWEAEVRRAKETLKVHKALSEDEQTILR